MESCFVSPPRFNNWNFIFHTAFHACHACCSSDAKKAKANGIQANAFFAHTNKKCLHGLWPPLYFAGGIRRRPCPVVRACLVHAWLPRTSHTPAVGTLGYSQIFALIEVHRYLTVSRNTKYKYLRFSSAMNVQRKD